MMSFVNMTRFLTFVLLIFLALPNVSVSDPFIFEKLSGSGGGTLGATIDLLLDITQLNEIAPGKAYTGPSFFPVSQGQMRYAIGIGVPDQQFKLIFVIRDWINGKPIEQLNETIFDSVKVTITPNQGAGKTISFTDLEFTKLNNMTQRLPLLSQNEMNPYTQGDFMSLGINIEFLKPKNKKDKKRGDGDGKTPAWKIVVPIVVVLCVAGIAVGVVVIRRRRMFR